MFILIRSGSKVATLGTKTKSLSTFDRLQDMYLFVGIGPALPQRESMYESMPLLDSAAAKDIRGF